MLYKEVNKNGEGKTEILRLLEEAANFGIIEAIRALKNIERKNRYSINDISLLKELSDWGCINSQYELGLVHKYGSGVEPDEKTATAWFYKAAEQGHRKAQYELGWRYLTGSGVEPDEKTATAWFYKAAEQGHKNALYLFGLLCLKENHFGNYVSLEVVSLLHNETYKGNRRFYTLLAEMYKRGVLVKENKKLALNLYRKAAEKGDILAQYQLYSLSKERSKMKHWKVFHFMNLEYTYPLSLTINKKIFKKLKNSLYYSAFGLFKSKLSL